MYEGENFVFGKDFLNPRIKMKWNPDDSENSINPHLLIVGGSGSGKTRLLKKIIRYLQQKRKQVYIIDFHGDISIPGETVYKFTARNSRYGLSPFEFEHDSENGGINMQVRILASTFKRSFIKNLGDKQRSLLMQLLSDCYRSVGIVDEDESTWNKELPTMSTLNLLYTAIADKIELKQGSIIVDKINKINNLKYKLSEGEKVKDKLKAEVDELKVIVEKYEEYVLSEDYEDENFNLRVQNIDISWYLKKENAKTFMSIAPYIKEISSSPVFNENKPPATRGVVRYDISGYTNVDHPSEAIFFADVIAQRIFRAMKMRGEYRLSGKNGIADTFIIVDESKLVLPTGTEKENPYHILNRIVTEARKYGLGWIGASQRPDHFPKEMTSSIDTKIILQLNKYDFTKAVRDLGIQDPALFDTMQTKGVALIGKIGKFFHAVALPWTEIKQ